FPLDGGVRAADADVDSAAEADVLDRVLAADVEVVRLVEDAGIAVRRAEQERQLLAAGDRNLADREVVPQDPTLEELQRRVVPDQLFPRSFCRTGAVDHALPLAPVSWVRAHAHPRAVHILPSA